MEIAIRKGNLVEEKADILVVNRFSDAKRLNGATLAVDVALSGELNRALVDDGFKGELGEIYVFRTNGLIRAKRVAVIGLGPKADFSEEVVRIATAASVNLAKQLKAKTVVSIFHGAGHGKLSPKLAAKAMVEGARLAAYHFGRYKKDEGVAPKRFEIVSTNTAAVRHGEEGLKLGELYAGATLFARELVNTPGCHLRPIDLVTAAKSVATNGVRIKVLDRTTMGKTGMGGALGVAQGSDHEPFFVHLVWRPKKRKLKKRIALVGKAVTFDSGGLSLKPAQAMTNMKCDMAGAAAVLGVFSILPRLAPNVEVHGLFAAVENMPSGKAMHPGDVVRIMNGKTVEVMNTDAEGRVTLADALAYATKLKPDAIVDLATLTGSVLAALGEEITGLLSNHQPLAKRVLAAAQASGERMWELPLDQTYLKTLKSDVADLMNIGGKYGDVLKAGLFLREFVEDTPWVHLDMAGPAFAEQPINAYTKKGASGHGVRSLIEFLRSY